MRKLPKRYAGVVMPFILSICMTCIVSAVSVIKTQGLSVETLHAWPAAWGLSWVIAFPVLLFVLPMVRKLVGALVESA